MTVIGSNLYVKEPDRPIADMVLQKDWLTGGQPQRMGVFDLKTGVMPTEDNMQILPRYNPPGAGRGYDSSGRQIAAIGNYLMCWGEELHSEAAYKRYGGDVTFIKIGDSGNPVQPFTRLSAEIGRVRQQYDCWAWDNTSLYLGQEKYDMTAWKKWLDDTVQSGDDLLELPDQIVGQWKPGKQKGGNRALALTANCLIEVNAGGDITVLDRETGAQLFQVSSGGEPYVQAMAVDRDGRIIVGNRNGDVVCYGSPHAASNIPSTNTNRIANQ